MDPIDTLINARWVVPIEPGGCVLEHHAVAIHQGRIIAVLPENEAPRRFAARTRIDRPTHVLLPGFVNSHSHAAASLFRGAADGAQLRRRAQMEALEHRFIDAEYVRDGTELAMADMIMSGATCFAAAHLFPEVVAQAASGARMRACVGLPVADAPSVWAACADEYLEQGLRLHDDYRDDPFVTTAFAPRAPHTLTDDALARVRRNADELDIPMIVPVNETAAHASVGGERTIARLERLGLISPLLAAVHMVHMNDDDVARLALGGASVVHCPRANLSLGAGVCDAGRLWSEGVNLALGADAASGAHDLSLLDELRSAALLAQGIHPESADIDGHAWLQAATLNGARALGLAEVTGSLIPGKWADLCCIDLARPQTQPLFNIAALTVFAASRDQVSDVWVAGRALLSDARLTCLDPDELLRKAARWRERIAGSLHFS